MINNDHGMSVYAIKYLWGCLILFNILGNLTRISDPWWKASDRKGDFRGLASRNVRYEHKNRT